MQHASAAPASHRRPQAIPSKRMNAEFAYYMMFLPALLLLIGVMVPFLYGVFTSFTNTKLYAQTVRFVWLQNYIDLFQDRIFINALLITIGYTILVIAIQLPLGLLVAQLLDIATPFRRFFRATLVLPMLIPPIVAGLMWKTMMHPASGVLNWLFNSVGLPSFSWLSNTSTALVSIAVIDTWIYMPFVALILLAGMQSVPQDLSEAARVDGASGPEIFRYIQLPWIMPYVLLVLLFRVADALKAFDLIYPTTRGGPINATRVMHVMAYEEVFRWSSMGRAMAIIFVLWLISYTTSSLLVRAWQRSSGEVKGV